MNIRMFLLLTFTLITFSFGANAQKDPVVMTIDNQAVVKSEFLRVYLKNNTNPQFDKESLDNYMDLYKKFRLKVAEAHDLQYDTIPALQRELAGYKKQLAQPYLVDTTKNHELINEAYDRLKHEIRASHILINVPKNATPADTLKAYKRIMELKKRIDGGEDFASVAKGLNGSEDPSVTKNGGDLGYFTAFQMVYPFESMAYNTPVGKVSMPVRSSYGYHIIKVDDKRPARGTITAAHIMVVFQKNESRSEIEAAEKKINEIYAKLQNGEDFEKLARLYSDDQSSKSKGGELAPFGSGTNQRMVTEFEDAAFALKKDGDYSEPFKTDYGFHIVKRIHYTPLGTKAELIPQIKQKINQGDRSKQSENSFIDQLKKENKFKDKSEKGLKWFYENIDSTIFAREWKAPELKKNAWLFKYNKEKYDSKDFLNFLEKKGMSRKVPIRDYVNKEYKEWQDEVIMTDEKGRLEEKYPAYKSLVQEYTDGILLYEIMKDKVWDKAIKDSTGLQAYYENNIGKYQWPERIEGTIYSSVDKENLIEAELLSQIDTLSMRDILKKINTDSELNLKAEHGKFIQNDKEPLVGRKLKVGNSEIFQFGDKYYFVKIDEVIPAGPKELYETRGAVIQDYQEELESNWLEELSKKHKVTINKEVLYKIGE